MRYAAPIVRRATMTHTRYGFRRLWFDLATSLVCILLGHKFRSLKWSEYQWCERCESWMHEKRVLAK